MSHDKQDKSYAESRSRIGSMSFDELGEYMGITVNPDKDVMEHESGTPDDSEAGNEPSVKGNSN